MSEVQVLKPDKDFSKEVDKQLPQAEQLAQVWRISSRYIILADIYLEQCSSCHREAHSVGEANKTGLSPLTIPLRALH
jgi:hypothetical protein